MSDWNIEEGTVTFWVRKNKVKWNDGSVTPLMNKNNNMGSIFVLKDSDKKVKFFHVTLGKGRSDIEHDVSDLDPNKDHFFAVTWSKNSKENQLFIDGKIVEKIRNEFDDSTNKNLVTKN
jgi:hypothetical protein